MRVLGVALAGVLTLSATVTAHSASLGSNLGQAMTGPTPGAIQVGNGNGSNWHPAPGVGGGSWHPAHSGPSLPNRGWGPYVGPGVPTYWVWGPSGGAFDYSFAAGSVDAARRLEIHTAHAAGHCRRAPLLPIAAAGWRSSRTTPAFL